MVSAAIQNLRDESANPKVDWKKVAIRAAEKHSQVIAELEKKVEQDSILKKEAAQFMAPFEDFLDTIRSVGFVNGRELTYNRVGYDSGYELHVVINDMFGSQLNLKKVSNPSDGLMDNALNVNCMSKSIFVNTVHSDPMERKQLNDGYVQHAMEKVIDWIMERHPSLLVEVARKQTKQNQPARP